MALWMALMLAAAGGAPGEDELPRSLQAEVSPRTVEGVAAARLGVWFGRDFGFKAIRTDSTQASSKQEAFFSASILAGAQFYDHFVLMASYEADLASHVTIDVGGLYLGWREHPKERYGHGVPDEVMIYAGVLLGRINVDEPDFGSFDRGVGFGGGIAMGWSISPRWTFQLYGEYRYLKFDYNRDVLAGDTSIGGNGGWIGAGLDFRF